jgi:hypothetical protein
VGRTLKIRWSLKFGAVSPNNLDRKNRLEALVEEKKEAGDFARLNQFSENPTLTGECG